MKKIKSSSKYIKNVIAFDWWKYLLLFLATSILIYYAFYSKLSLKRYEQLQIFTTAEIIDEKIRDELEKELEDEGTLVVSFYNSDKNSKYYDIQLDTNGFVNSDILLLPASKVIDNENIIQNSQSINNELKNEILSVNSSIEFLTFEDITYALKVYDIDDSSYNTGLHFTDWAKFDETYYVLFSKKSPNLGKYGDKSKEENHSAIEAVKYLVSERV